MLDLADADLVPVQAHGHARLADIAAPAPERLVAAMALRLARIAIVAIHRGECGPLEAAQRARMRLARVEERMADAASSILRQQHRFAAIEHLAHVDAAGEYRHLELGAVLAQRNAGAGTDSRLVRQ